MPEQAEPRDVGAGMNPFADRLNLLNKRVLAAGHGLKRSIQLSRFRGAAHGPCK